tara:strand:- start:33 stop:194 length:162 start_codon:yes stop_codon:yes gene_type:complete
MPRGIDPDEIRVIQGRRAVIDDRMPQRGQRLFKAVCSVGSDSERAITKRIKHG